MARSIYEGFPSYREMELPLLEEIARRGGQVKPIELYEPLADFFGLTQEQRKVKSPSRQASKWINDVQWVRKVLVDNGELYSTDDVGVGTYKLTPKGESRVNNLPVVSDVLKIKMVTENEKAKKTVERLLQTAERTQNILLYGPPGTGKTWLVTQFAKRFTDPNRMRMVTFHQSFAYEEFVEGIRPVIVNGKVDYAVRDGVFKHVCKFAQAAWEVDRENAPKFLLIIDEINRANIAKVLGELITLIEDDKRLGEANEVQTILPYSGEKFGVPPNLTILGTMNTADRSIALLDLALRRRFTFVGMPPDPALLPLDVGGVNLQALLTRLNQRVAALLDPDHRIGHSYLMNVETEDDLHFAWYHRVLPLLQEYFYHDSERMQAVVGEAFVQEVPVDAETKKALGAAYEETAQYESVLLTGEAFLLALRKITEQ